jgi:hypothetical protein
VKNGPRATREIDNLGIDFVITEIVAGLPVGGEGASAEADDADAKIGGRCSAPGMIAQEKADVTQRSGKEMISWQSWLVVARSKAEAQAARKNHKRCDIFRERLDLP